jgi:dephospho-CoA kinase
VVRFIGLTGGIGAGKSTVAQGLAERGAVVVDADRIAREVVMPGQPAFGAIVDRFGSGVVGSDGALDRAALAKVVFSDADARADLEKITHPAIQGEMARRMLEQAESDRVVVLDIPLLKERRDHMAGVIVVDVPEETAIARLVAFRDFDEADARARVGAQISREARLAIADVVIDNSGDPDQLEPEIDRAWAWACSLRR